MLTALKDIENYLQFINSMKLISVPYFRDALKKLDKRIEAQAAFIETKKQLVAKIIENEELDPTSIRSELEEKLKVSSYQVDDESDDIMVSDGSFLQTLCVMQLSRNKEVTLSTNIVLSYVILEWISLKVNIFICYADSV